MAHQYPSHDDQVVSLKRIEGQVRGIIKMIDEKRYCVDILTQLSSISGALIRVQDNILEKHLGSCVVNSLTGKSALEKHKKIAEIVALIRKFRKNA